MQITLQDAQPPTRVLPQIPSRYFRGRDPETAWLEESFAAQASEKTGQRISVLYGMGGVGKTQLALSYAYKHRDDYRAMFWITATNMPSVIYGFREIAQILVDWAADVRGSSLNFTRIAYEFGLGQCVDGVTGEVKVAAGHERVLIDSVTRWLSKDKNTGWLLVFDSADDLETVNLASLFPNVPNGDILVTSWQRHSALLGRSLELQCLKPEDATNLLIHYGGYGNDQGLLNLFQGSKSLKKEYRITNKSKR